MIAARRFSLAALAVLAAVVCPTTTPADVKRPATAAHRLEVRGADTMVPLMRTLAEAYMTAHPDTKVIVDGHYTERGVKALIVGVADMAMAIDRQRDDTEALAAARGVTLARTCVFLDAVVPVVAPGNPVHDIALDKLRDVFRGKITNWKQLGGDDAPIVLVTQEATSGAYETWQNEVLGEHTVVAANASVVAQDAYYDRITANAISFTGMNYVKNLQPLSVNGVAASLETVRSRAFPIVRESCLYQRGDGTPLGNAFIAYALSPAGEQVISAMQLVPVPRPPAQGSP